MQLVTPRDYRVRGWAWLRCDECGRDVERAVDFRAPYSTEEVQMQHLCAPCLRTALALFASQEE